MKSNIKLYQTHPIKIYIITNGNDTYYINSTIIKKYRLKEEEYENLDIKSIYEENKKLLIHQAKEYLSKAERSILAFDNWLKKRMCQNDLALTIKEEMIKTKFLSQDRYAENFLRARWETGSKPLWIVKEELKRKKINIDIPTDDYDEVESLTHFIKTQQYKLNKDKKKFIGYLLRKGFKYELIQKAIDKIQES